MNLKSKGTFQLLFHNGESYLLMNPEATLMFVVSHVEVKADATTILTPLGNFNEMSKARRSIERDAEKQVIAKRKQSK